MPYQTLLDELKIEGCVFSITRLKELSTVESTTKFSCITKFFSHVVAHGPLVLKGTALHAPGPGLAAAFVTGSPIYPAASETLLHRVQDQVTRRGSALSVPRMLRSK